MATSVHRITKVHAAGKYCEIWLDPTPTEGRDGSWDVAPKWGELNRVVEEAGLDDHVLNHGYVGLRLVIEWAEATHYKLIALSTSKPPEEES